MRKLNNIYMVRVVILSVLLDMVEHLIKQTGKGLSIDIPLRKCV